MDISLIKMVEREEDRGKAKWGHVDRTPTDLLAAILEETGEIAHAVNHDEGAWKVIQEIAEAMGVLSRLFEMIAPPDYLTGWNYSVESKQYS